MNLFYTKKNNEPIIERLDDIDIYKFYMQQFVFHRYPDIKVKSGFKNRTTSVRLGECIDINELKDQLDYVRTLRYTQEIIQNLNGIYVDGEKIFKQDYLDFLPTAQLPEYDLEIINGYLKIEYGDNWAIQMNWETIILSIIAELYTNYLIEKNRLTEKEIYKIAMEKLLKKVAAIRKYDIKLAGFSTRRRATRRWHDKVVEIMKKETPDQFLGTSNVALANKHNTKAIGTSAHELPMVVTAIQDNENSMRETPIKIAEEWFEEYGKPLSILLPDTYGTAYFLKNMPTELAINCKGFRIDSKPPIEGGEQLTAFYKKQGINTKTHILLPSDGLVVQKMIDFKLRFQNEAIVAFGWGTNKSNDIGFDPISIVVKPISANGNPTVKLSDNIQKAIGPQTEIERYARIFQYHEDYSEQCIY